MGKCNGQCRVSPGLWYSSSSLLPLLTLTGSMALWKSKCASCLKQFRSPYTFIQALLIDSFAAVHTQSGNVGFQLSPCDLPLSGKNVIYGLLKVCRKKKQKKFVRHWHSSVYSIKRCFWPCRYNVKISKSSLPYDGNPNSPKAKLNLKINPNWTKRPVLAWITQWILHVTSVSFICRHTCSRGNRVQPPDGYRTGWGVGGLLIESGMMCAVSGSRGCPSSCLPASPLGWGWAEKPSRSQSKGAWRSLDPGAPLIV